jgi:hypothetical protein
VPPAPRVPARSDPAADVLRLAFVPVRIALFPAKVTINVVTWIWRRR